jgi:hypothetical protein
MFGLNIDPNNHNGNPNPSELKELGVQIVRYTFYDTSGGDRVDQAKAQFYRERARAYRDAGINSLVILTYDTYPNRPSPEAPDPDWDRYIEQFARRSGQIADLLKEFNPAFQIWNEPDHHVDGSYAPTLREAVFARMLRRTYDAIRQVMPQARILTAGLAKGDPSWLTRVVNAVPGGMPRDMIVAFHPYGQRPEPNWPRPDWAFGYVGNLLNNYYQAGQRRPLWITEMGVKIGDVDNDPNKVAEFLRRYYNTIQTHYSDKVQELIWFCYSDGMVPPFGLVDGGGNRKPIYNAYHEVATAAPVRDPAPVTVAQPPAPVAPPPPIQPPAPVTPPAPAPPTPPIQPVPAGSTGSNSKPIIEQIAELRTQLSGFQGSLQQLQNQIAQSQAQANFQQLQNQLAQMQGQLQQLSTQQVQLQNQVQQLQSRPAPAPVQPAPQPMPPQPAPVTPGRPAPPIQNIINQLKRHPTQRFGPRPLNQIQQVIIHHTAIPPHIGADRIANYGVDSKGWIGFRYHFFITGDGLIQQTNELTTLSDHAGPYSSTSVGVGFAGNFNENIPTPAQLDAGAQLCAWLLRQFKLSIQAVIGFKELINTQSPGLLWDDGVRWGDQLKARIQIYL